jgi:hypothetical protein
MSEYIERQDGRNRIEGNENYAPRKGNAFLMCSLRNGVQCVGSVDFNRRSNLWEASCETVYDPVTDCDSELLGAFEEREQAIDELWTARQRF